MLEIPSRDSLASLTAAADTIARTSAIGFARALPTGKVAVLYSYGFGLGQFVLTPDLLPDALHPSTEGLLQVDRPSLDAQRTRATEAFLIDNQTQTLVSMRLAGVDSPTRFWLGFADASLSPDQLDRLAGVATRAATILNEPVTQETRLQRMERLEQAAELIPALLHVLDVRQVIDRLSATATRALPHDLLFLNLFSEDLSTATVYARSDKGTGLGIQIPNPYPASTLQAWAFSIVDDHRLHPFERNSPSTRIGARASLRFPIRFGERLHGGVAFLSFTPGAFSDADVPVGLRLSEHVASAVSHFRLAEQLAEEARRTQELRTRTTNLELLDELLAQLTTEAGLKEAFERISAIARKVLPHDAMGLPVFLPDGRHARRYAAAGMESSAPEIIDVSPDLLDPSWEYQLVEDLTGMDGAHDQRVAALGFLSALRMPIDLDGKRAAVLDFWSKQRGAFTHDDILVARRIVDRLAVALAREHTVEAGRRAAEASERAARLEARVQALTQELNAQTGYRRVVGESASWKQVLTQATQVSATETTALLLGESGTGKEVVARLIHRASTRSHGPFVALNCAALPEQLLEAELFGYERGAFTGATQSKPGQLEQAAGGTLFLDEVGEMSLQAQAKFLRVLQEREFQRLGGTRVLRADARIVAATNRDLLKAIANAQFREDLFYRLNVFAIRLPALRDRRDDVLPLTDAFLKEFGRAFANPPAGISREAKQLLVAYHWPGNIRELRNILERAAILCDGGLITSDHLALPVAPAAPTVAAAVSETGPLQAAASVPAIAADGARDLRSIEKATIEQALQNARFNKSKAAKELGLTRHQLYIRMRRHGIDE